jgi:hypothetical protein
MLAIRLPTFPRPAAPITAKDDRAGGTVLAAAVTVACRAGPTTSARTRPTWVAACRGQPTPRCGGSSCGSSSRSTGGTLTQPFVLDGVVIEEARRVADDLGLPYWWLNEQASIYISGKALSSQADSGRRGLRPRRAAQLVLRQRSGRQLPTATPAAAWNPEQRAAPRASSPQRRRSGRRAVGEIPGSQLLLRSVCHSN